MKSPVVVIWEPVDGKTVPRPYPVRWQIPSGCAVIFLESPQAEGSPTCRLPGTGVAATG